MRSYVWNIGLTLSHLKRSKATIKDPGTCPACDVINFYPERRRLCSNWEANFDLCACTNEKVVQRDSGEKQGRILPFKGRFESFGAILAYNRPKKVKNV